MCKILALYKLNCCYGNKNGGQNRLKIEKSPLGFLKLNF